MATSWPGSRTVVAAGAKVYFYDGATLSPRTTYQDAGLTTPHAHPVVADSTGRFPRVYLQDGLYRERVLSSGGVVLWDDDGIDASPTVIPESVDAVTADQLIQTGTIIFRAVGGIIPGYARCNGRTIGNAASGATERANADTVALFAYLWNGHADTICPVGGGRGASAAADFAANKVITLYDARLAGLLGVSGMGNTALTVPATLPFATGTGADGGSVGGANTHTLDITEIPSHTHTVTDPGHTHNSKWPNGVLNTNVDGNGYNTMNTDNGTVKTTTSATTGISLGNTGGDGTHNNVQKSLFVHFYIKL